jgi:integrase
MALTQAKALAAADGAKQPQRGSVPLDITLLTRLNRVRGEGLVRPQTALLYEQAVSELIRDHGEFNLAEATPSRLGALLREVYGTRPTTHRHALGIVRAAIADAVEDDVLDRNIASELRMPKKRRPQPRALTAAQAEFLIARLHRNVLGEDGKVVGQLPTVYSDAAILQLATGSRVGEVCALRWVDLEFDDDSVVVTFAGTVVSRAASYRQDEPKTSASFRTLRVRDRETIAMLRRRSGDRAHPELVFPGDKGGVLSPHTVQAHWRKARAGTELDAPWVTPHVARRTFVTDAIERGWSYERTAAAAGHSDPGTSRRIYREQRPDVIDLG